MNLPVVESKSTADREIVAERLFNAPRDLVFRLWTDREHIGKWWGPTGFTLTILEMDARPGGVWRFIMHGSEGRDYHNRVVFIDIVKPERIVYKHEPEKGSEPVNSEVTVTFSDEGGKTRLNMRMLFPSAATRNHVAEKYGAVEGLHQTLGRLEQLLAAMV